MGEKTQSKSGVIAFLRRLPTWAQLMLFMAFAIMMTKLLPAGRDHATTSPPVPQPAAVATIQQSPVEACAERGIAYFSSVGSYPKLSDGRNALEVARERCGRTLTAF